MSDTPQAVPEETSHTSALSGGQLARAAGIVMAGFVLARLLGLGKDIILAEIYQLTGVFDAFITASRPPETIYLVAAGGALGSAFIPEFVGLFVRGQQDRAWRMASSIINAFLILMAVLSALAAIFADPLVRYVLAPGFAADPGKLAQTVHLMRIMLITPFIFTLSGLMMGILNARQRFFLPALAPSLYNLGIIFGALFLAPDLGIDGVAWGSVLGALLHLAVQLPGIAALRPRYSMLIDFKDEAFWRVVRLMGPRVIGLGIVQVNFWVELSLASFMVHGSASALHRGFMLMLMPQAVIAQSIAIAVFPTFAEQVAAGERDKLRHTYGRVLRSVLFLSLPATLGLIILRLPIVRTIYEHGDFTLADSQAVAWALLFFSMGLVFHCMLEIVTRAFYAMQDTRTPVMIGGAATVLNIIFCLTLQQVIGQPGSLVMGPFGGLALANTLATAIEVIILLGILQRRIAPTGQIGHALTRNAVLAIARMLAAGAAMGIALWLAVPILSPDSGLILALETAALIGVGGALYWGIAWALGSDEARMLMTAIMTRFLKRRSVAGAGR